MRRVVICLNGELKRLNFKRICDFRNHIWITGENGDVSISSDNKTHILDVNKHLSVLILTLKVFEVWIIVIQNQIHDSWCMTIFNKKYRQELRTKHQY